MVKSKLQEERETEDLDSNLNLRIHTMMCTSDNLGGSNLEIIKNFFKACNIKVFVTTLYCTHLCISALSAYKPMDVNNLFFWYFYLFVFEGQD